MPHKNTMLCHVTYKLLPTFDWFVVIKSSYFLGPKITLLNLKGFVNSALPLKHSNVATFVYALVCVCMLTKPVIGQLIIEY